MTWRRFLFAMAVALVSAGPVMARVDYDWITVEDLGGDVRVRWMTSFEDDARGFSVFRGDGTPPTWIEVTPSVLRTLGAGSTYEFIDTSQLELCDFQVLERTSAGPGDRSPIAMLEDTIPPDQGNVLRAVQQGRHVKLDFTGAPATLWRLFRDAGKWSLGATAYTPTELSVPIEYDIDAMLRSADDYYQLRGLSECSLTEGP